MRVRTKQAISEVLFQHHNALALQRSKINVFRHKLTNMVVSRLNSPLIGSFVLELVAFRHVVWTLQFAGSAVAIIHQPAASYSPPVLFWLVEGRWPNMEFVLTMAGDINTAEGEAALGVCRPQDSTPSACLLEWRFPIDYVCHFLTTRAPYRW